MCGIAGIVAADRLTPSEIAPGCRACATSSPTAVPTKRALYCDEHAGARAIAASASSTSRAGQQPLANEDGTHLDRLQRRDLQPRGDPARARVARPPLPHAVATPKRSSTPTRSGATTASSGSAACSRSRSGTRRGGGCCSRAIGWASSRSTGRCVGDRLLFGSEIKAHPRERSGRAEANEAALPELLEHALSVGHRDAVQRHSSSCCRAICSSSRTATCTDGACAGMCPSVDAPGGARHALGARDGRRDSVTLLEEAVRTRLMADVPLGMFLSGGIDSSAIAALMARMIDRPLQTFSVAFERARVQRARIRTPGRAGDRRRRARSRHRRQRLLRRAAAAGLARGRADRASIQRAALLRLEARERARQGRADRRRQRRAARPDTASIRARCVNWRAGGALAARAGAARDGSSRDPSCPAAARPRSRATRRRSFLAMPRTPEAMFFDNFAAIGLRRQRALLDRRLRAPVDAGLGVRARRAPISTRRTGAARLLDRLLYTDIKTYLVELLMKQDQMSMAASIESRVPFLDHTLVEFAATLPPRMKLRGLHDQVDPARGGRRTPAARDPRRARRWASRCRSRLDARTVGGRRARRALRSAHPRARHRSTIGRSTQLLHGPRCRHARRPATRSGRC